MCIFLYIFVILFHLLLFILSIHPSSIHHCFDMWSDHIRTCESGMMGTTAETPRGQQGACRPVEPQPDQQSSAGVHQSHDLSSDNKRLTCSILRKYRRPICKATGDNAHTQKLCPEATLR
uniref:Nanos-type domain-containing protein n=1 Tax=Stegastes partitus TaxID=144197 RepID=A0A3B4Z7S6_9TELE